MASRRWCAVTSFLTCCALTVGVLSTVRVTDTTYHDERTVVHTHKTKFKFPRGCSPLIAPLSDTYYNFLKDLQELLDAQEEAPWFIDGGHALKAVFG